MLLHGWSFCSGRLLLFATALCLLLVGGLATADEPATQKWHDDYRQACAAAKEAQQMLLIWFADPRCAANSETFQKTVWEHPDVATRLGKMVAVKLPIDSKLTMQDKEITLLQHPAFAEMLGQQGLAIIDFAHPQATYHGHVVSVYPFRKCWISHPHLVALLDLPPGTLTQRTLTWAVRTHREAPASAWAQPTDVLFTAAEQHSQHQANIGVQGHHQWESRFQQINSQLGGMTSSEVCAEGWPWQNLVEAAEDCVHCWRQSPGHWSSVSSQQAAFGYDMKRGRNNVWYATGIFGKRR